MAIRFVIGLLAGLVFALLGFGKHARREKFDTEQLIQTLVVGALSGMISEFLNLQLDLVFWFVLNVGFVAIIEYGLKTFKRKLWPGLFR